MSFWVTKTMIHLGRNTLALRHWWPRIGRIYEKFSYTNSDHYCFMWLLLMRDKVVTND